jgi:hypothetical protein
MSEHPFDPVEAFWDALFSRDPDQIHAVFDPLDEDTRQSVIAHLVRMITEKNWHPEQAKSARFALVTIKNLRSPQAGENPPLFGEPSAQNRPARKRHSPKTRKA